MPRVGEKNFPMSHERYIAIPPRVAKYHHEWGKKITTSGEATSGEFIFPMSGDISPRVVELRCTLSDEWRNLPDHSSRPKRYHISLQKVESSKKGSKTLELVYLTAIGNFFFPIASVLSYREMAYVNPFPYS